MTKNINNQEWKEAIITDKDAVIIDVRTPEEWNEGVIEGAILKNVMLGQAFVDQLASLDKSKNYYVYCRSGARSSQACSVMQQLGFQTTINLAQGIMGWDGDVVAPVYE